MSKKSTNSFTDLKPNASDDFTFSTKEEVFPVNIDGEDYELREASGNAACQYRDLIIGNLTLGDSGKPQKISHIASAEPLLVSLCLFKVGEKEHVPQSKVASWPARIQKKLFKKVKEMSDLDDETVETEEALKND